MFLRDWQTRRQPVCQKRREKLYTNGAENLTHFVSIKQLT